MGFPLVRRDGWNPRLPEAQIGTVVQFPLRRDAEKAATALRVNINSELRVPETVTELIAHYRAYELSERRPSPRMEDFIDLTKHIEANGERCACPRVRTET